jgi:hypothetical protein
MPMAKVYFIVGSYFGGERLTSVLNEIRASNLPSFNILVNEQCGSYKRPAGVSKVWNGLINAAMYDPECKYIWFIADDVSKINHAIELTTALIDSNPDIGCAFPQEMTNGVPKLSQIAGKITDFIYPMLNCAVVGRHALDSISHLKEYYSYFDEAYPYGQYQDIDFGLRLWRMGWKVVQNGYTTFEHEREGTYSKLPIDLYNHGEALEAAGKRLQEKWPFWNKLPEDIVLEMCRTGKL